MNKVPTSEVSTRAGDSVAGRGSTSGGGGDSVAGRGSTSGGGGDSGTGRGRNSVPGILAALGGRAQWRWWAPFAIWLLSGLASLFVLQLRGQRVTFFPSLVLVAAGALGLVLIWAWGSRFALSLGHRRGWVFAVTTVASFAFAWFGYLMMMVARRAEQVITGWDGMLVFQLNVPGDKFYSEQFFDTFVMMMGGLFTPVMVGLACLVAWVLRWGIKGAVPVVIAAVIMWSSLLFLDHFLVESNLRLPFDAFTAMLIVFSLILLAMTWWAFRKQPVTA